MEDYLIRGIIAFLPRIEQEEVKPTSEHPENWNQHQLQEKANPIILEDIIKLACIDDTRDGFHTGSRTRAFWVIQALYAMSEEDDVKEIQASYLALGIESSIVQEVEYLHHILCVVIVILVCSY